MGGNSENNCIGNAYITVTFAMLFLAITSVLLSSMEAVRVSTVRLRAEIACAIACEAFLSQYEPRVQARYGLYLVERDGWDTAFLKQFIEDNCGSLDEEGVSWLRPVLESVAIDGEIHIEDEDFRYLEDQISDLMKTVKGSQYAGQVKDSLLGLFSFDVETKKDALSSEIDKTGETARIQQEAAEKEALAESSADGGNDTDRGSGQQGAETGTEVEDPRKNITAMLKQPILALVMNGEISEAVLDRNQLSDVTDPERDVNQIGGFMDYKDVTKGMESGSLDLKDSIESLGDGFLVHCYIIDFFKNAASQGKPSGICYDASGNLTEDGVRRQIRGETVLEYEAEYIICGKSSDAGNLQSVVNRISLIRMVMNMTYLLQNPAKSAAVHSVAAALAAAALMPFLEEVFYILIMAAWAYGEALVDCRCLLGGGKVPFFKSDTTWTLSLSQLGNLGAGQLAGYAREDSSESGHSYEDYLQMLLLTVNREKKYIRLINLIEANTRLEDGGQDFNAGLCVFGISICADFTFLPFFYGLGTGRRQYEHHVSKSIAY